MRVEVYWNLHKLTWSVRDKRAGRVIAHIPCLVLDDCKFVVRQSARLRVLRDRRRSVHAWVEGDLDMEPGSMSRTLPEPHERVTYNPYKYETFVRCADGSAIATAPRVLFQTGSKPEKGPRALVYIHTAVTAKEDER